MIRVTDLHKHFGSLLAVDGVSFAIDRGEVFGLLGPNGAGKTTTIHMIVGALAADSGMIEIGDGGDPTDPATRRQMGVAPQSLSLYEDLSGAENLAFFARLYGLRGSRLRQRVEWGLAFAGLESRARDAVSTYSGGMQRRLNLACALAHEPRVLFCDEPTVGVDPQSRNHIFECIERLRADGMTILYTTHYMEEAERLCDRVAIIDDGRILALDRVEQLILAHGGKSRVTAELAAPPPPGVDPPGGLVDGALQVETHRPLAIIAELQQKGFSFGSLRVDRPDLESVFLALTGKRLRDGDETRS